MGEEALEFSRSHSSFLEDHDDRLEQRRTQKIKGENQIKEKNTLNYVGYLR
jgi:hypothetical protein